MANEIQMTQTFQEKVFNKIRDSIGDLMSEEDLKKLVEAAMQKAFFEPRFVEEHYGRKTYKESWLQEKVGEILRNQVNTAINDWIAANPNEIKKAIDAAIAKGMFGLIMQHFESRTTSALYTFGETLKQQGVL